MPLLRRPAPYRRPPTRVWTLKIKFFQRNRSADEPGSPGRGKIFYGWWIVGAAAFTNGTGGALQWQGFTVLFLPVSESLGLGLGATALAFGLARAENGVVGPLSGWLIDRYGVRPLMFVGTIIVGIGYLLLSQADDFITFLVVYILVISIGASTSFMQATTASINSWFIRKRGLAMSINAAAFRLGGAAMVPILSVFVLEYGWQNASIGIGLMMLFFVTPMALVFRRSPEAYGLNPDGDPEPEPTALVAGAAADGHTAPIATYDSWTTREALKTRAFWVLSIGTMLRITAHGTIFVHMIAILDWKDVDRQVAANMVGGLALVAVPLILLAGYYGDRIGRTRILSLGYATSAVSLFLVVFAEGTLPIFFALLLFTGSEAGSSLNWALVGDLFGRRSFATIRGMMAPLYNSVLMVGPVAAGFIFDWTDTYTPVLVAGGVLMLLAAVVFMRLEAPVRPAREIASEQVAVPAADGSAIARDTSTDG
ncbi:MAG: MFS transporter [Dehalococcoidia bacterium]|nr:MFS transporter [Dehalococcoidia bacterium]